MCKLILLGGIPGVGKTTIAYELASIYKIDKVLSIDILKNIIKKFIKKEAEPYLYTTTHEAHTLENLSIIDGYKKHSNTLNKYVIDILNNFKNEKILSFFTFHCPSFAKFVLDNSAKIPQVPTSIISGANP